MAGEPRRSLLSEIAPATLQRLPDLTVNPHPARCRKLAQERLLHQCVCEPVAARLLHLFDYSSLQRFLDQSEQVLLVLLAEQR